ncbi:MAG: (d)CMP kinase [Chlamydiales bacterium]|nr:(d)CMP kinase [Chlamydiales bacterium]
MIITIDGPSGTGKSTVARLLAQRLKFDYLDSGAMYRTLALQLIEENIDPTDLESIEKLCEVFSFRSTFENNHWRFFLGDREVTKKIRTPKVTELASKIAPYPFVRKAMSALQRAHAERNNLICEGRDIGTVIFPDADLKIFLTASPEIRSERRYQEMQQKFPNETHDFEQIKSDILIRDATDSNRDIAPLRCAEDAYRLDTSDMSIEEVVDTIIKMVPGA